MELQDSGADDGASRARPVLRMGDPVLRRVAEPVADPTADDVRDLIAEMEASLEAAGGIGLAAPQIGVPQRVILISVPASRASDDPEDGETPLTALINPEITPLGEDMRLDWEGCLSIPDLRGEVPRHHRIHVTASTPEGGIFEGTVAGWRARVIQHEVDHLDGVLYLDRMIDLKRLGFTAEIIEAEAERKRLERGGKPEVEPDSSS